MIGWKLFLGIRPFQSSVGVKEVQNLKVCCKWVGDNVSEFEIQLKLLESG